eukprot:1159061-Pelagomonas_calceolata.AAC.6
MIVVLQPTTAAPQFTFVFLTIAGSKLAAWLAMFIDTFQGGHPCACGTSAMCLDTFQLELQC